MTLKARILKTGISVSLAATLAIGAGTAIAQPELLPAPDDTEQQLSPLDEQDTEDVAEVPADVAEAPSEEPAEPEPQDTALLPQDDASSKYDPRSTEGTSGIRDQFWGTCWAMSGISSTESFLIHTSKESTDVLLSVEDMLWWVHDSGWNMFRREDSGFPSMATGFLTTAGVRAEADIPYLGKPSDFNDDDMRDTSPSNIYGEGENLRPANYNTAPVLYEITDVVYVRSPSRQEIKDLITQYGAVSTNYKSSEEYFDPVHSTDWGNGRYDEATGADANHAVSVVGWDDSFPKEYFVEQNGKRPQQDGAWILKNSYGTNYGSEGGFIYVSYDDEYLFIPDENPDMSFSYAVAGARKPVEQKRYLHDAYGAVSSWQPKGETTCTWANVFDFGAGEQLNELSFVTWTKGGTYELFYAPMSNGVPTADESAWIPLAQGSIDHAGYKTVSANWDANVPSGKGAIVLRVSGEAPSIGTETYLTNVRGAPLFIPDEKATRGTGYFLQDGTFSEAVITTEKSGDTDTEYPILCIRAYTIASETPDEDDKGDDTKPDDQPDVTPDDGGTPAPDDSGKRQPSNKPSGNLPKTGDESPIPVAFAAFAGLALMSVGAGLRLQHDKNEATQRAPE